VVYRWEADGGDSGSGFVLLQTATGKVRSCDASGQALGTLAMSADDGDLTGETDGVHRPTFMRIAAAILGSFIQTGTPPQTAHRYFA
jgi:hypothetical protein